MSTTTTIIETAPLHGIDLTVANPVLPHHAASLVVSVPIRDLDGSGTLATEPDGDEAVSRWRETRAYFVPPMLDPERTDMRAERERLGHDGAEIVTALQKASAEHGMIDRGFQRKTLYVTTTAEFRVPENFPAPLAAGPFRRGMVCRAIVRFSSASSKVEADGAKDQRAVGVRITDDRGRVQDLTFTSGSAGNHARNARQFNSSMIAALRMARGGLLGKARAFLGLLAREGIRETIRLSRARRDAAEAGVSLAALRYYSRSPVELGSKLVHLGLFPVEGTAAELIHEARAARDGLGRDLCFRRGIGDVRFRIVAAQAPGLDDGSVPPDGPWVTVAELRLPMQRVAESEMLAAAARLHGSLAMHPFNVWERDSLTPRGELNEILRKPVYTISARNSGRTDQPPEVPRYGV